MLAGSAQLGRQSVIQIQNTQVISKSWVQSNTYQCQPKASIYYMCESSCNGRTEFIAADSTLSTAFQRAPQAYAWDMFSLTG